MTENNEIGLEDLLGPMMAEMGNIHLGNFCEENPDIKETLKKFSPVKTAAIFSGLLTFPEIQSNCLRLEVLVHLAAMFGENPKAANKKEVANCFLRMGETICGRFEDPAEDVFVSLVSTPRGNFRTFEGLWESNSFFLQRFLNIIETLPDSGFYNEIRRNVFALLKLGEEIARRSKTQRYSLGNEIPLERIPSKILNRISSARKRICFTEQELEQLGISQDDLWGFIFDPSERKHLLNDKMGHTALERRPVALEGDLLYVLLPTSIGAAIRRYVIEKFSQAELLETFEGLLALEYADLFSKTPILGSGGRLDLEFKKTDSAILGGVTRRIDRGRFLSMVFIVDNLQEYNDSGLAGVNPVEPKVGKDLKNWLEFAIKQVKDDPDFITGFTLIVSCGWGRSIALPVPEVGSDDWYVETCSAADLQTLSWVRNFKPLSLLRILETRDLLKKHNVSLENINGLLNLVAYSKLLNDHLVPHAHLPDDFASESTPGIIMIDQNSLKNLRHEVSIRWDPHYIPDETGALKAVRKEGQSSFKEDDLVPIFVSEDDLYEGKLKSVYEAPYCLWWCEISVGEGVPKPVTYEYWKMLTIWLKMAAPVLDKFFGKETQGPVLWLVHFDELNYEVNQEDLSLEALRLRNLVSVSLNPDKNTIRLDVKPDFEKGFSLVENTAERILVEKFVEGVSLLTEKALSKAEKEKIVGLIVPDINARHIHRIHAHSFRDRVRNFLPRSPLVIDNADDASLRIGLARINGSKKAKSEILGREKCLEFLNETVESLENSLCEKIKGFEKKHLLQFFLENHEVCFWESDHWGRTSKAVLSLHQDKQATYEIIAKKEFELNAASLASRLLVEVGNCECVLEKGSKFGKLDASRLMAQAMMIAHLAGLSDAIHWNAIEPRLKVTALGDIHFDVRFFEKIIVPFGQKTNLEKLKEEHLKYSKHFEPLEIREFVKDSVESDFNKAWESENKFSIDEMRLFIDCLEDYAIINEKPVFEARLPELQNLKSNKKSVVPEKVTRIIDSIKFTPRSSWREVPEGFLEKDRQPWRFRRRLSVIRNPLIQINDEEEPTFLVSPGLIRQSFLYNLTNFFQGSFPPEQAKTKEMRKWIGKTNHEKRKVFSKTVEDKMKELGWEARSDINVTEILGTPTGAKDFGDVDVVAWDTNSKRVLLMECKDVQFKKTPGEIAEQLSTFQGITRSDGKADLLKKHLDRIDYLKKNNVTVAKYVGISAKIKIEGHLVFKNPVPMKYAWDKLQKKVKLSLFEELETTFKLS